MPDRTPPASRPAEFDARKARILCEIASPGPDASPKGSIDVQILPLIHRLNAHPDVVTTSSCSGRISVFLEAAKKAQSRPSSGARPEQQQQEQQQQQQAPAGEQVGEDARAGTANAGIGGKGEGGRWLFVSHDPVELRDGCASGVAELLLGGEMAVRVAAGDVQTHVSFSTRFVHVKFESMILHVQTRDLKTAHGLLSIALSCGFRESGIMNPGLGHGQSPILAIRSAGLAMDSIVGVFDEPSGRILKLVDDEYLKMLVEVSNIRFQENQRRIELFRTKMEESLFATQTPKEWEDKEARRARKREEGLKRQQQMRPSQTTSPSSEQDVDLEPRDSLMDLL